MAQPTPSQLVTDLNIRMETQFAEIKAILSEIGERQRAIELREAGYYPLTDAKVDAAFRRIDDHSALISGLQNEVKKLTETITELRHTNKILTWIGGLMASTIILWILNQILHLIG